MKPSDSPVQTFGGSGKGKCPKEAVEQISWFNKIRQEYPDTWGLLAVHVRNEGLLQNGQLSAIKKHKLEGMVTGCVDIFIPGSPCMVLEMKRTSPALSTLSPEQAAYLVAAEKAGAFACVCFGALAAMEAFTEWLTLQP